MRPLFDLNDQVVAVAGAAGAFGSVIVEELIARGCRVAAFDRDPEILQGLMSKFAANQTHCEAIDATDESQCETAFSNTVARWGRLDGLVNCVGIFKVMPSEQMPLEVFSNVIETNLNAGFLLCRSASAYMIPQRHGRIINITSVSDTVANPGYAAYASSKAALAHLTRILAKEWARYSITVNAIGPAMSDTDLTHSFLGESDNRDYALSRIPMNRMLDPEDLLGTAILLLSPAGAFITGQVIHVDGGRTLP